MRKKRNWAWPGQWCESAELTGLMEDRGGRRSQGPGCPVQGIVWLAVWLKRVTASLGAMAQSRAPSPARGKGQSRKLRQAGTVRKSCDSISPDAFPTGVLIARPARGGGRGPWQWRAHHLQNIRFHLFREGAGRPLESAISASCTLRSVKHLAFFQPGPERSPVSNLFQGVDPLGPFQPLAYSFNKRLLGVSSVSIAELGIFRSIPLLLWGGANHNYTPLPWTGREESN